MKKQGVKTTINGQKRLVPAWEKAQNLFEITSKDIGVKQMKKKMYL